MAAGWNKRAKTKRVASLEASTTDQRAAVGSAFKRAEHRRSGEGEEVRVSERSEFRTALDGPRSRGPVRSTGSRPAARFGYFSFRAKRKVTPMNHHDRIGMDRSDSPATVTASTH